MTLARALAAAALGVALGCTALHARQPSPGTLEGEWGTLRIAATRRVTLYDALEHRATATATHLGLAEREARARRLAEWLGWTPQELERRLAAERAEAAQYEEFVVALYTAQLAQNDLDATNTVWRVAVVTPEGEYLPLQIRALDSDANVTALYPYVGVFDTVYRIRFPVPPAGPLAGREYVLQIASGLGKMELDFGKPDGVTVGEPPPPPP